MLEADGYEVTGEAPTGLVAISQAVFALAPAILGAVHDVASNYTASFAIAAAIQFAAAGVVLLGRSEMSV